MSSKTTQNELADRFARLHVKGDPLVLFNVWDAGSARAVEEAGAMAIATGSWSVAAAFGYEDRQRIPLEFVLANAKRIVDCVSLPVTIDFEGAYAKDPADVAVNVQKLLETGAVGINFEDQIVGGTGLYDISDQCERIRAIRDVCDRSHVPFFINARTDVFLKNKEHEAFIEEAIVRASAYAEAGAGGFFAPGLRDARLIQKLCESCALPVNILMMPDVPASKELAGLGVGRISYGPYPYRQILEVLKSSAKKAFSM